MSYKLSDKVFDEEKSENQIFVEYGAEEHRC